MNFAGEYRFRQSAHRIWAALNDPAVLKRTLPGCEEIEQVSETEFAGTVKLSVGPMKLRFAGRIILRDLDPPWRYTIACEGSGGLAGRVKASAQVTMSPDFDSRLGTGTALRYSTDLALNGMIATLAEKLLQGTAARVSDEFFDRFAAQIPPEAAPVGTDSAAETRSGAPDLIATPQAATPQQGLHPIVWSVGLTVVTGIILAVAVR